MKNVSPSIFEERLTALIKDADHCLLTLTGLLRKFPGFSEKGVLKEEGKSVGQPSILAAFEVAIAKLASLMSRPSAPVVTQQRPEKESNSDTNFLDYR